MKLSLIIPVYNEAPNLQRFLTGIDELDCAVTKELVIVNDCSTDGSKAILDAFSFRSEHKIIHLPVNRGKGAAIQTGIAQASGDIIGVQDADFEYDIGDISTLIEPLLRNRADIVYGSRFKKSGEQVHRTLPTPAPQPALTNRNRSPGILAPRALISIAASAGGISARG